MYTQKGENILNIIPYSYTYIVYHMYLNIRDKKEIKGTKSKISSV